MSQHDGNFANASGASVRSDLNDFAQAVFSTSKGTARPATPVAGQLWLDENTPSAAVWSLFMYDGDADILIGHFDSTNNKFNVITNQSSDVASAATVDLDAAYGMVVDITGTTNITAITLAQGRVKLMRFASVLVLTHGSSLLLPNLVSWTTAAGDWAIVVGGAAAVVRVLSIFPAAGNEQATSMNGGGPLASYRNAIINGGMDIWQRGTSFATAVDASFSADRWWYTRSGVMVNTLSRSTDVPTVAQAGRLFNYSLLVDCTTIDAAIAAGDFTTLTQSIEGFNWAHFAQRALTLSFWVKATKTGVYCASLRNSAADRSYVGEYTVNSSDTWEFKTVRFSASPSAGTWDYTNGIGARLTFAIAGGSTYQTTAGAWQAGNFFATSSQVNGMDNTANNFRLTGVQLEIGGIATPFEYRPFQSELSMCQRYFESSYPYAFAPGTAEASYYHQLGFAINNTFFYGDGRIDFKVSKRAAPTIVVYSTDGTSGVVRDFSGVNNDAISANFASESGFSMTSGSSALTTNNLYGCHWTAAAEIQ